MKLIQPPKMDDVNNAITALFQNRLLEDGYLYLSINDIDFSSDNYLNRDYSLIIEEYFTYHRWYLKTAFRKRQLFIFNQLLKQNRGAKLASACIFMPNTRVEIINSVSKLLKLLRELKSTKDSVFYRGQSNFRWALLPSIYRDTRWVINEKRMIDKMLQTNPEEFNFTSTFDILSKLQHYNLPTRLIDVTNNPLVALYFACKGDDLEDGQFFIFNPDEKIIKYADSDTVSVLSNLSKMDIGFGNGNLKKNDVGRFIHFIRKEKPYFEDYLEDGCLNKYVFVHAAYNNKRIAKQNGAFILVGIKDDKSIPAKINEDIVVEGKKIKYIIPFDSKRDILKELDLLSVNSSSLFPEIENVSQEIRNSFILE